MDGESGTKTIRCRTVAHGRLRQAHHIRDLPAQASVVGSEALSAADEEPNALETLLSAFGACLAAGIHANAIARHIGIRSLALDLSADVDESAHWGTGSGAKPLGFEAIEVVVKIEADAPDDALNALVKHATLWSPVANTLHDPVHLKVSLGTSANVEASAE